MTTPAIFEKYPTVKELSKATFEELFPFIKSISYPNNKTKHLIGMAKMVEEDFGGEIPMTVAQLIKLPGVGRIKKIVGSIKLQFLPTIISNVWICV